MLCCDVGMQIIMLRFENELSPSTSTPLEICGTEKEDQGAATISKDPVPNSNANKGVKRAMSTNDCTAIAKEKAEVVNIGIDAIFHQMELPNTRLFQLHNMMPRRLQGVVPTMFHSVASTQLQNVASAQVQNSRLPH